MYPDLGFDTAQPFSIQASLIIGDKHEFFLLADYQGVFVEDIPAEEAGNLFYFFSFRLRHRSQPIFSPIFAVRNI